MTQINCPVCGYEFPVWLDDPPASCCQEEGRRTPCRWAMDRARGEAVRRRLCPDAFDENGKIKDGQIVRVLRTVAQAGYDPDTGAELTEAYQRLNEVCRQAGVVPAWKYP